MILPVRLYALMISKQRTSPNLCYVCSIAVLVACVQNGQHVEVGVVSKDACKLKRRTYLGVYPCASMVLYRDCNTTNEKGFFWLVLDTGPKESPGLFLAGRACAERAHIGGRLVALGFQDRR